MVGEEAGSGRGAAQEQAAFDAQRAGEGQVLNARELQTLGGQGAAQAPGARWVGEPPALGESSALGAQGETTQHALGSGVPALDRTVRLEFVRRPDRLSTGYGQFADALTELEVGHVAGALVENAPRFGLRAYADGDGVTLEPGDFRAPGKLPKRSSGLGPRGLAADPRPLPIETLTAFIRSMEQLPAGTLRHPGLQHRLAVHNVAGARDGWYTVDVRRTGAAMDTVQDCHGHPQAVIDVSGMNLALIMAADVPAAVRAGGPGEYQALLRAAGALGQHVCTAAAKAGMFCRPLRSFDDPALEAAAGFPLSHSLLYVLLAGRPKVVGPAYDLSPLEAP
jgi:hypothetical protein